ncbi:unnamed protein product [Caenorhabditis auriculariae]|uniref:Palmitoyltransferase n=1 Tax=Caenorhabditis auriculariae TaxID=2777116 RepID=A0A8S1GUM9_9PELO|nr:unnamed protein product [Caenorhabditis auriculariae]
MALAEVGDRLEPPTHDPLNVDRHAPKIPQTADLYAAIGACQHGRQTVVDDLLRSGLSPNSVDDDGCSLLHWAAINNRIDVIKILISYGGDPNKLGGVLVSSPLHWAARNGHVAVCAVLVKAGAVCNVRDAQGYTPVHLAIQGSHVPLVAYFLLKFDYVKDITDNSGMTPAMWCAYRSFAMFPIRLVVRAGADLSLKEHLQGSTALHFAAQERNYSAVVELLKGGADISIRNKQQETALDIARNHKNLRIIEQLEQAGRKQGHIRSSCRFLRADPPLITYFFFFLPLLVIVGMWFVFAHLPLTIALLITAIFFGFILATVHFDFHAPNYRLLPIGITVAEASLMLASWANYAHWYVPWWLQLLFVISFTSLIFSLVRITVLDPGIVKPKKDCHSMYIEEAESGIQHQEKYCFTCFVRKLEQTKHCAVCDHCVLQFDHHCPWLHKCITRRNMREFILFVTSVMVSSLVYCLATGHFVLLDVADHGFQEFVKYHAFLLITVILSAIHAIMLCFLLCVQLNQISLEMTTNDRIKATLGGTWREIRPWSQSQSIRQSPQSRHRHSMSQYSRVFLLKRRGSCIKKRF